MKCVAAGMGVAVLSVEELICKSVKAYESEKMALKQGDAPPSSGDNESQITQLQAPNIIMESSSGVQMDVQTDEGEKGGGEDSQQNLDSTELSQVSIT